MLGSLIWTKRGRLHNLIVAPDLSKRSNRLVPDFIGADQRTVGTGRARVLQTHIDPIAAMPTVWIGCTAR